jgi:ketosteroid isomerase-like protein
MGHPHAELMRKASELLNAGDFPGFLALHTEDVVMHVPGNGPLSGDHRGQDRIAAVFQKEMELLDAPRSSSLTTTSEATTTSSHSSHRSFSEGAALEVRQTIVAHVREGRFSEVWIQPEDLQAFDEFFGSG